MFPPWRCRGSALGKKNAMKRGVVAAGVSPATGFIQGVFDPQGDIRPRGAGFSVHGGAIEPSRCRMVAAIGRCRNGVPGRCNMRAVTLTGHAAVW